MTEYSAEEPSLEYTIPFQLTKKLHRKVPDLLSPFKSENSQKGKIIVITGGGTGIGAAAAKIWVQAGAAGVVIASRRQSVLDETAKSLNEISQEKTKILAVPTDLVIEKDVVNLFSLVNETFGRPADVVLANAGVIFPLKPLAEEEVAKWWNVYEVNVLGLHNTIVAFIRSQPDPKNPVGTVINVNSGLAGLVKAGVSAYSTAKFAAHRYMEYVGAEYPSLRIFTLLPGIVPTDLMEPEFAIFAQDEAEQTGALALYLASPRADYLRNSLTSINWDLPTMEAHKEEIENGLLKVKWVSVLPCAGGTGI